MNSREPAITFPLEMAPPASPSEASDLKILDPARLRFFKMGATLRMTIEGEMSCLRVTVLRAFPLTDPLVWFSVRDGGGKEVGMLRSIESLDAGSRRLVEEDLERRYMVATVLRVLSVKERFGTVDWDVETHRGKCRFTTRDLREHVLRPAPGHFLLTDVENNRYEIPDVEKLDESSQKWLMRHL